MAIPTKPDRDKIIETIAKRSGNPRAPLSEFFDVLEEVKADMGSVLPYGVVKSLEKTKVTVPTISKSSIALPADLALLPEYKMLTVSVLTGSISGVFQAGSTTSVLNLASGETSTLSDVMRNRILVTTGSAVAGIGDCYEYNATTKVATVDPPLGNGAPGASHGYLVVDTISPLELFGAARKQAEKQNMVQATAKRAFISISSDALNLIATLRPVPDVVYGIEMIYPVDITQVDLTSAVLTRLYQTWRNLWIQGGLWRRLQEDGDSKYKDEREFYYKLLESFSQRESIEV